MKETVVENFKKRVLGIFELSPETKQTVARASLIFLKFKNNTEYQSIIVEALHILKINEVWDQNILFHISNLAVWFEYLSDDDAVEAAEFLRDYIVSDYIGEDPDIKKLLSKSFEFIEFTSSSDMQVVIAMHWISDTAYLNI